MSDKDFVERETFRKCFANASLLICLCHTLRSFGREVTCEKMRITAEKIAMPGNRSVNNVSENARRLHKEIRNVEKHKIR